jgi:hypothetical protein
VDEQLVAAIAVRRERAGLIVLRHCSEFFERAVAVEFVELAAADDEHAAVCELIPRIGPACGGKTPSALASVGAAPGTSGPRLTPLLLDVEFTSSDAATFTDCAV